MCVGILSRLAPGDDIGIIGTVFRDLEHQGAAEFGFFKMSSNQGEQPLHPSGQKPRLLQANVQWARSPFTSHSSPASTVPFPHWVQRQRKLQIE